jgi:hypothetical protein
MLVALAYVIPDLVESSAPFTGIPTSNATYSQCGNCQLISGECSRIAKAAVYHFIVDNSHPSRIVLDSTIR